MPFDTQILPAGSNIVNGKLRKTKYQSDTSREYRPLSLAGAVQNDGRAIETLDIYGKLPSDWWREQVLKEAARRAGVGDLSARIADWGDLPSADDLKMAVQPPAPPEYRPVIPGYLSDNVRLNDGPLLRPTAARPLTEKQGLALGHFVDLVAEIGTEGLAAEIAKRRQEAEDACQEQMRLATAWGEIAREVAAITAAISMYVGDTPYLGMIHFGDKEVRERAEEDVALALSVVQDLRPSKPVGKLLSVEEDRALALSVERDFGLSTRDKVREARASYGKIGAEQLRALLKSSINEDRIRELAGGNAAQAEKFVRESMALIDKTVDRMKERPAMAPDPSKSARDISEECGGADFLRKPPAEADLAYVLSWGLDVDDHGKDGYESRLFAPAWHRRRIRKHVRRTREHVAYILRIVGAHGEKCVSGVALDDRRNQLRRQAEWGDAHEVVSPANERTTMSLIMRATREALLARTWAVVLGMQEEARLWGLTPMWITLTTPSEFHPAPKRGEDKWNPNLTPKDAREWLQERWANVRAWLAKEGIKPFGIWTVEPHEDGCPHIHMLLWVRPEQKADLAAHIRRYWPKDAAAKIVEKEDSATRQVAYYVWSYLAPALKRTGDDGAGEEIKGKGGETAERYDSHAATWGYRRYGFFGLASGTLTAWQKVYRSTDLLKGTPFARAKAYMDEMDWHGALRALGAFDRSKPRRRLEIFGKTKEFTFEYVKAVDGYGDEVKRLAGVSDSWTSLLCRSGCTIQPKLEDETEDEGEEAYEPSVTVVVMNPRGAAAPPATAAMEAAHGPPG